MSNRATNELRSLVVQIRCSRRIHRDHWSSCAGPNWIRFEDLIRGDGPRGRSLVAVGQMSDGAAAGAQRLLY